MYGMNYRNDKALLLTLSIVYKDTKVNKIRKKIKYL